MSVMQEFDRLADLVEQIIVLLGEAEETFWATNLKRGLGKLRKAELAGATSVLGCYNGADSFSDLVVGRQWETSDPLRFRNLNARLGELRNLAFASANQIASRNLW